MSTALNKFLESWSLDSSTAEEVGPSLACGEAQSLADLFRAEGYGEVADEWLTAHAESDDHGDQSHTLSDGTTAPVGS